MKKTEQFSKSYKLFFYFICVKRFRFHETKDRPSSRKSKAFIRKSNKICEDEVEIKTILAQIGRAHV